MSKTFFCKKTINHKIICSLIVTLSLALPINIWGQEKEQKVMEELVNMGFENVRWVENETEQIYTIENNVYRLSGIGVKEAISIIQKEGLPKNKICKIRKPAMIATR